MLVAPRLLPPSAGCRRASNPKIKGSDMKKLALIEPSELPAVLRQMRGDMTLKDAAERAGLSLSFISDMEHGRTKPSLDTLEALINVYDGRFLIAFEALA